MTTATTYIFEGKESTLEELSEKHRIPVKTLERRLRHGISIEDAIRNNDKLTKEANRDRLGTHAKLYNVNGVDMTAKEVQKKYGINAATFIRRVERGMEPTTAAKMAVQKHKAGKNDEGYSDPTATKAIDNTSPEDKTWDYKVDGVPVSFGDIWSIRNGEELLYVSEVTKQSTNGVPKIIGYPVYTTRITGFYLVGIKDYTIDFSSPMTVHRKSLTSLYLSDAINKCDNPTMAIAHTPPAFLLMDVPTRSARPATDNPTNKYDNAAKHQMIACQAKLEVYDDLTNRIIDALGRAYTKEI